MTKQSCPCLWNDNSIQFPRLITELEAAGAFTSEIMSVLRDSMDLTTEDISELVDRAQNAWRTTIENL